MFLRSLRQLESDALPFLLEHSSHHGHLVDLTNDLYAQLQRQQVTDESTDKFVENFKAASINKKAELVDWACFVFGLDSTSMLDCSETAVISMISRSLSNHIKEESRSPYRHANNLCNLSRLIPEIDFHSIDELFELYSELYS